MTELHRRDLISDPIEQFRAWYEEAVKSESLKFPDAMALATVSAAGRPENRMVLLKDFSNEGFSFFTNLLSRKGQALSANPFAALTFYWDALERQVRIEGQIHPVSDEEADNYFITRPRESQIGAWVSKQSHELSSRRQLEQELEEATLRFGSGQIPRPVNWGGYLLVPSRIEFWQLRPFRLHDRFVYEKVGLESSPKDWKISRLYP